MKSWTVQPPCRSCEWTPTWLIMREPRDAPLHISWSAGFKSSVFSSSRTTPHSHAQYRFSPTWHFEHCSGSSRSLVDHIWRKKWKGLAGVKYVWQPHTKQLWDVFGEGVVGGVVVLLEDQQELYELDAYAWVCCLLWAVHPSSINKQKKNLFSNGDFLLLTTITCSCIGGYMRPVRKEELTLLTGLPFLKGSFDGVRVFVAWGGELRSSGRGVCIAVLRSCGNWFSCFFLGGYLFGGWEVRRNGTWMGRIEDRTKGVTRVVERLDGDCE